MKRTLSKRYLLLMFLFLMVSEPITFAQSVSGWTKEKATVWYKKGEWLNGLKLRPHKSTDQLEFARQYSTNKILWDKAFAFLRDNNLDSLKPGKYVIDGENVFADVTETPSTELVDAKWHSHRKYCDIQYVIKGKENTGVAPIKGAPIITPFGDSGDAQFYSQDMKGTYYLSDPNTFLIFFPSDVHRPFIKVDGYNEIKRIRFKIKSI
jgi:biofilm protein TabA